MSKQLSQADKIRITEQLVERDGGHKCLYCKKPFVNNRSILEHLNDDRKDNRLDNLVLACQSCNIKKSKDTSGLYSDIAFLKLEANESQICLRAKDLKKITKTEMQEIPKEIDINTKNYDITEKYIKDRIDSWGSIEFKDTLDSCVFICKDKTGHGSHQCVRSYIGSLTSSVAPYQIVKENSKKSIVKRTQ